MKKFKKYIIIAVILFAVFPLSKSLRAQVFYLGVNYNAVYSWFDSPDLDNFVTSDGWGWDLGFFVRYGKRPFVQLGFDWTRSLNRFSVVYFDENIQEEVTVSEDLKLNNFDFSLRIGYEVLQTPMFKIDVHGGPFIGRSLMFSGETIYFDNSDFKRPQLGINGGVGFQFTNFIFGLEYNYHFTELFNPIEVDDQSYRLGSKIQMASLKVGLMF